jgi:hypothetical protein
MQSILPPQFVKKRKSKRINSLSDVPETSTLQQQRKRQNTDSQATPPSLDYHGGITTHSAEHVSAQLAYCYSRTSVQGYAVAGLTSLPKPTDQTLPDLPHPIALDQSPTNPLPCIPIIPAKVMVIIGPKDGSRAHDGVCTPGGKYPGALIPWAHEPQEGAILLNAKLPERAQRRGEEQLREWLDIDAPDVCSL